MRSHKIFYNYAPETQQCNFRSNITELRETKASMSAILLQFYDRNAVTESQDVSCLNTSRCTYFMSQYWQMHVLSSIVSQIGPRINGYLEPPGLILSLSLVSALVCLSSLRTLLMTYGKNSDNKARTVYRVILCE